MKFLARLVITLAILVVIYGVFIRLSERSWLFVPAPYPVGPWYTQSIYHAHDIRFPAADGSSLDAWWVPGFQPRRTVLLFHSRHGNISNLSERLLRLQLLHSNVLAVDYRGYGKSQGRPSVAGVLQDGESAYQYLTVIRKIPPQRIVVQGDELGAAVAASVAARHPQVAALVLESPFPSLRALGNAVMPGAGWFLAGRLPVVADVQSYPGPKLILFGGSDNNVPAALSQAVFNAARPPKLEHEWPLATQNHLVVDAGRSYSRWMQTFYQDAHLAPKPRPFEFPSPVIHAGTR